MYSNFVTVTFRYSKATNFDCCLLVFLENKNPGTNRTSSKSEKRNKLMVPLGTTADFNANVESPCPGDPISEKDGKYSSICLTCYRQVKLVHSVKSSFPVLSCLHFYFHSAAVQFMDTILEGIRNKTPPEITDNNNAPNLLSKEGNVNYLYG